MAVCVHPFDRRYGQREEKCGYLGWMISVVLESLRKGFLNNGRHRNIVKKVSCGSGGVVASCWDWGRDLVAVSWQWMREGTGDIELWLPLNQDLYFKLYNIKEGGWCWYRTESSGGCPFFSFSNIWLLFSYLPLFCTRAVGLDLWTQITELPLEKGEGIPLNKTVGGREGEVMWVNCRKGKSLSKSTEVHSAKSFPLHSLHSFTSLLPKS